MLIEEAARRTGESWKTTHSAADAPLIIVGRRSQISSLLPVEARSQWASTPAKASLPTEGFTVKEITGNIRVLIIAGNDSRGVLFGVGYVLRKISFTKGHAELSEKIDITTAPQYPVRGHQIGYRFKNNTYDAWTVSMFEQHIRDLAVFGNNSIQVIAPESDDEKTSPLYPAPALDTLIGICKASMAYGMDFDLYYPEMAKDYSNPATVQAELVKSEELFKAFPHIDAFYVPGGDPGHTEPKYLLSLVEKQAAILHKYHPKATVWISAQGFKEDWYSEFYEILRTQHPHYITGFFVGPQSRESFASQRAKIPMQYKLQAYPDIAHAMHSQLPLPLWDTAYSLSEGREPMNPRPMDETEIYRYFAKLHSGFITYSEGVNDDVNKMIWDQLGWSAKSEPIDTLRDYSRYFIGAVGQYNTEAFAQGILALERNWAGPLLTNSGVNETFTQFQQMEQSASPEQLRNWRFESALYRAYYDVYTRNRLLAQTSQEQQALSILLAADKANSMTAIHNAEKAIALPASPIYPEIRTRIFSLADNLFRDVGLQLSVKKYGASGIERGANLDRVDVDLNDRAWMLHELNAAAKIADDTLRLEAIHKIARYTDPGPGGFYDDLGDISHEPHLVLGHGWKGDPQLYNTTINGIADKIPDDNLRVSWINYAETLYDHPIEMIYYNLDKTQHYRIRITYGGEDYTVPIRLVANDTMEIHAPLKRDTNPKIVEYDIPQAATATGTLDLKWTRPNGIGGGGRGLQVAEVWLMPQTK